MKFKVLNGKSASNERQMAAELKRAGIPLKMASHRLGVEVNTKTFGMLIGGMEDEMPGLIDYGWLFYRRQNCWMARPLHNVCHWSPTRIKRFVGKRQDIKYDLLNFLTEFEFYSDEALGRFVEEVCKRH